MSFNHVLKFRTA